MFARWILIVSVLMASLHMAPSAILAQNNDPYVALDEIAGQSVALAQVDTIYRLSEELVFWQSVALLGAEFGWEFSYETSGTNHLKWTIRLDNARQEGEIEAKRAAIGISRSKYVSDDQKKQVSELFNDYSQMKANASKIHKLLTNVDIDGAESVYENQTLALRRDIAGAAYSVSQEFRRSIADIARNSRP